MQINTIINQLNFHKDNHITQQKKKKQQQHTHKTPDYDSLCQKIYLLLIVSEVKMSVFMTEERLQKPGCLYVYKKMPYFTCNQKHYSSRRGTFSLFVFLHDHHNKLK